MKDISTEADSAFINLKDATVKFCGQTFPHQVVKLRLNSERDVIPLEALALHKERLNQHGWTQGEGGHMVESRARAYQKVELPVSGGFEIKTQQSSLSTNLKAILTVCKWLSRRPRERLRIRTRFGA